MRAVDREDVCRGHRRTLSVPLCYSLYSLEIASFSESRASLADSKPGKPSFVSTPQIRVTVQLCLAFSPMGDGIQTQVLVLVHQMLLPT